MRWLVTLSGTRKDVERLAAEALPELSVTDGDPPALLLTLDDPEGEAPDQGAVDAGWAEVDATVQAINGYARLRWGRRFTPLEATKTVTVDAAGHVTQRVFLEAAVDHMAPEDFADMVERMGHPRPALPEGLELINALAGVPVTTLAATNPEVARALHLIDLMLAGDREIDWVAAYAALEVIEQDLHARGLNGQKLGWWTADERERFKATANSVELLGFRARHGRRFDLPKRHMNTKDGSWFVRRAVTLWVTHLLADHDAAERP